MKKELMIKEPNIRIGLLKTSNKISISLNGAYTCPEVDEIFFNQTIDVQYANGKILIYMGNRESFLADKKVAFIPRDFEHNFFEIINMPTGIHTHLEHEATQAFQGIISFESHNEQLYLINEIIAEKYLMSVVSSEISSRCHEEFLKTHAIISRSWLIANIEKKAEKNSHKNESGDLRWYTRDDHHFYDVCGNDHCQRYQGISRIVNLNTIWAVEETKGLVLVYDGKICDARFSKCCGGITESYENVWDNKKIPYLISTRDFDESYIPLKTEIDYKNWIESEPDSYCNVQSDEMKNKILLDYETNTKDFYRWQFTYTNKELSELIKINTGKDIGKIIAINPLERGYSGRIIRLEIIGANDKMIIGKELEIRRILSHSHLYSAALTFNITASDIQIKGAGWGHGVGLCQIGAAIMAEKGYHYKDIISRYFPNAAIEKIY